MLRTNWVYRVFCVMVVSVSLFSVAMADTRKYMLGDIDGLHYDGAGSVDHVYVDPDYWAKLLAEIHPPIAFDVQDDNHHVPGTFLFPLAPGEQIVAAHCTIAMKGVHPLVSSDGISFETSDGFFVGGYFTEWGWDPISQTEVVTRTVDLSNVRGNNMIPHMQDGLLSFSTNDDTAVDYAILTIEVIPAPSKVQDNFKSPEARAAQFRYKSLIIPIERAYAAKLKKIQSGRAVKLKAARSKFVKKLDEALKKEIQAGNLDEAIKIRDAKRRIKKTSDNSVVSIIQNNWNFKSFEARTARFQYESLVILAEKTYASKVKKIQEERDVKLQTIKDKLVKKLDEALKKEVQSGNLDEAIKIRNAKRAFEKAPLRPKPPEKTSPPPKKTVPKEVRQHKKDKSFTIKALIDGDTKLVITPKGIFWRNGRVKKLGKSRGNNDPTLINGKPWLPVWGKPHATRGRDETKPFPLRIGRISNVSVKTIAIATEKNKSGIRRRTPITVHQSGKNWIVSIPDREPGCMWYTLRITIK